MARLAFACLLFWTQLAAFPLQEPAEEDVTGASKVEYAFNPLQAEKEIKVARYYMKKGSYKAARNRFEEAVKWNPTSGEAYLGLAEACEKQEDADGARQAYLKFLEVSPDSKEAAGVKKKVQQPKKG